MAEIKLNKEEWESLSDEDRASITQIMRENGLLEDDEEIIPDPDTPPTTAQEKGTEGEAA